MSNDHSDATTAALDALGRLIAAAHRDGTAESRRAAIEALAALPPGALDRAEQARVEAELAALPDAPAPPDDQWPPLPL
jgi:hypothetical protein